MTRDELRTFSIDHSNSRYLYCVSLSNNGYEIVKTRVPGLCHLRAESDESGTEYYFVTVILGIAVVRETKDLTKINDHSRRTGLVISLSSVHTSYGAAEEEVVLKKVGTHD